jgi:Fe-S-cluster-containing hydrogenase component 2
LNSFHEPGTPTFSSFNKAEMMFLRTHFDLCTGCCLCQLACSQKITGGFNPRRSVLKIDHARENLVHFPIVCTQCQNPFCASVCPVQAISLDQEGLAWTVDPEACTGCGLCAQYCPLGVIHLDQDTQTAVKCDLCGGDPECVRACPTGALELITIGDENV